MPTNWIMQIAIPAAPKLTACALMYSPNDSAQPCENRVGVLALQLNDPMVPAISAQQLTGIISSGVTTVQSSNESTPQHSNWKRRCEMRSENIACLAVISDHTYAALDVVPNVNDVLLLGHVLLHRGVQLLADQGHCVIAQHVSRNSG